jgi:Spy/CpxP family protein refolding chaperone
MRTRRTNPKQWLGFVMIALGVIILAVSLSIGRPVYYTHGMYGPPMYAYPYHPYGRRMGGSWMGTYGMPYPGSMMSDGYMMPGLDAMQGLDLTPDQQARIDAVQSTADTKRRNLLDSLGAENEKLNTLLSGESRDTDALTQQYARCAQLRRQIFELGLDERQKIDAVLTDDQRKQWRQWLHAYTSQ